jgi:hypothetical protein
VKVDALDVDDASIKTAHANVAVAGLADRVRPAVHDASAPESRSAHRARLLALLPAHTLS